MRTLVIGRSTYADIVLADESVAPHHAELVVTDDGRFFLTDCASATGTWRRGGSSADDVGWTPVRQTFVRPGEPLRLGKHGCTAADLAGVARLERPSTRPAFADEGPFQAGTGGSERPRGRVERNPVTGEIVRRRR